MSCWKGYVPAPTAGISAGLQTDRGRRSYLGGILPFLYLIPMGSWKKWLKSQPLDWRFRPTEACVEAIRKELLAVLDDCHGFECDRLRWRLHMAECAQELWLLRTAVFQVVSYQHCQAQAAERINGLVPAFQAALPAQQLTRV